MLRYTRIIIILISLLSISFPGQGNRLDNDTLEDSLSLAASPDDSLSLLLKLTEKYRYSAPQKSIEFGKLSIEIAYRINDQLSRTIAYTLLGQTYYEIGVYDKALENYSNALTRCIEKYNKLFEANCFTNIGKVYREIEVYQLAISKFEDAHKLFMEEENHKGQAQSLFNLGVTYAKIDDFDQSMQYFNDVLDFDDKLLNDQLRASTYKNIGNVFLERGNIKMAADFYDRAMNIFIRLNDNKNISSMNVRYSDLLMSHHDHQGALDKLIEAEKIFDKLNNRKRLAKTYLAIAKVSMISGDHDRTTTSINQAIAIAHEYTIKTVLKDAYFLLHTFYSGNGEIETALEYFLMYNDLHEAVLTKELINTIALTETRNTFVQHQINIDSIDSEKQVQKYTRWFALILISLTVLIVFLSFSRLISQRKANVVLARQRNILKETLAELKINEEKYKALFSQANDAIFLMDKETFVDCNDETLKMFACKREEIIGLPPYTFSPEKQPDGQASRDKALAFIKKCYFSKEFAWAHNV